MATTPKIRRTYVGNAVATTITGSFAAGATTVSIAVDTGWPAAGPFYAVIDPGTSTEEKILVGSITGTSLSSITRGVDGTTDVNHSSGASIYPVFTAIDADEANQLTSTYANKGGIVYLGDPSFTQLAIGTAGQVIKVSSGGIPEWGQVAAAGIATDAVTAEKILAGSVGSSELANDSVLTAKIKDAEVTLAKLASAAIQVLTPTGIVSPYAGDTAPTGWLLCYGQAISRTDYADLFTAIGITYGSGNGTTTFNLPDLRGRVVAGVDNMGGSAASRLTSTTITGGGDAVGEVGGSQTHPLTTNEMPSHQHGSGNAFLDFVDMSGGISNRYAVVGGGGGVPGITNGFTSNTGGGLAHNNVQPTMVLNYIIKA